MNQRQTVAGVFARAWGLLTRNWIIIVPGIVVGAVVGMISELLLPLHGVWSDSDYGNPVVMAWLGGAFLRGIIVAGLALFAGSLAPGPGVEQGFVGGIILAGVAILAYVATTAYAVGMAGAAWARGTTTLADGSAALKEAGGNVAMTALGLIGPGIVATILALVTILTIPNSLWMALLTILTIPLTISLLAFWIFALYAMPAAIIGRRRGFSSIAESLRIGTQEFDSTLIIAILIAVIWFCAEFLTLRMSLIPFLGPILCSVVTQIVIAFAMLVIVGEYLNLRAAGAIDPPVSTGSPEPFISPPKTRISVETEGT